MSSIGLAFLFSVRHILKFCNEVFRLDDRYNAAVRNSGLLLPNDIHNQREYGPKLTILAKMCVPKHL